MKKKMKMNLKKLKINLQEDKSVKFEIESSNGNAYGSMPSHMILSFLSQFEDKPKSFMQKLFSDILLETFKPITDFIERYGFIDTPWYIKKTIKFAMDTFEYELLQSQENRILMYLFQKQKYFGW